MRVFNRYLSIAIACAFIGGLSSNAFAMDHKPPMQCEGKKGCQHQGKPGMDKGHGKPGHKHPPGKPGMNGQQGKQGAHGQQGQSGGY
jgi:hypothetical protein